LPPQVVNSFKYSLYKTVKTTMPITLTRTFGGTAKLKGTFASTKLNESREKLALLDEWDNSMRFEATIEVPENTQLNLGKVGPQTSSNGNQYLAGGADQVLLPLQWTPSLWVSKVTDRETGIEYSYNEFVNTFPEYIHP